MRIFLNRNELRAVHYALRRIEKQTDLNECMVIGKFIVRDALKKIERAASKPQEGT